MTYKEKAPELVQKFKSIEINVFGCSEGSNPCIVSAGMFTKSAIDCAIITVDELLVDETDFFDGDRYEYWIKVKKELELLNN